MKAKWFSELPPCPGCGRQSTGVLMSQFNDKMGAHCKRCALKRIQMDKEKTT